MIERLYTGGTNGLSLRQFSHAVQGAGIDLVLDTRRHANGQLAGWAKADTLRFVLELVGVRYLPALIFAPTAELLAAYRRGELTWPAYATAYQTSLDQLPPDVLTVFGNARRPLLLCTEQVGKPCHRHLLAAWLAAQLGVLADEVMV